MTNKDLIKQRRSIRRYTNQPVSDKLVLKILEAASYAPSAHNTQPYRFILISDTKVKQRLANTMAKTWVKDSAKDNTKVKQNVIDFSVKRFSTAPVLIIACLTFEDMKKYSDTRLPFERDLGIQSLGAALQNVLLSASENGLGACWFSAPIFCKDTVRQTLEIPETVEPQAIILMGYPNEKPIERQRKTVNTFCFRNVWDKPI